MWRLSLTLAVLVLAACTSANSAVLPAPTATAQFIVEEQTRSADERVLFVRLAPSEISAYMAAALTAKLVVKEGCLRLITTQPDDGYAVVWPPEFTLVVENGAVQILNGEKTVVAREGEWVYTGGGIASANLPSLPIERCSGPYWIASPEARLFDWNSKPPIENNIIDAFGQTLILTRYTPALEDWFAAPSVLNGEVVYEGQCLRLKSETASYALIWPHHSAMDLADKEHWQVVGAANEAWYKVVQVGEVITLLGLALSESENAERFESLKSALPPICPPPYWLAVDAPP